MSEFLPTDEPGSAAQARSVGRELAGEYSPAGFRLVIDQYPDDFRQQIIAGYMAERESEPRGPKG